MRMSLTIFLLFTEISLSWDGGGQRSRIPALDSLLKAGIDLTLRQEYESATNVFRNVSRNYPDHPAGSLYQMAVLQAKAMDYEEIVQNAVFDSLLAEATMKSHAMIERDPDSPWGHYFLGTAFGHDSYARAQSGDWFGTITRGLSAVSQLEEAVERDSSLFDAFLGMGTYFYWKTRKIEFLTWLPFIRDDRSRGIELLERCAAAGTFNRYSAMGALVSIYLDAGEYDKADSVSSRCLAEYPSNRIFLWGKATALDRKGFVREAFNAYETLLGALRGDTRKNSYNELVCRLRLASLSFKDARIADTERHLAGLTVLQKETFPDHLKKRAADKFQQAKELAEKASKHKSGQR